jgi:hypothetical protein
MLLGGDLMESTLIKKKMLFFLNNYVLVFVKKQFYFLEGNKSHYNNIILGWVDLGLYFESNLTIIINAY